MNILVHFRQDYRQDRPVETYARSVVRELSRNNTVSPIGEGHEIASPVDVSIKDYNFFLEVDCGRNSKGESVWFQPELKMNIPSAAILIDNHGNPSLHKRMAPSYTHVFFAVWFRRDLFSRHPSAHWLPCATDLKWFGCHNFAHITPSIDWGFHGSKGGLSRADMLREVCEEEKWTYDIRQIGKAFRHRWPHTAAAMSECKALYNRGQKHDINQRIFESMAVDRPLVNDVDPKAGLDKLFEDGKHFVGYDSFNKESLRQACFWVMNNPEKAREIASNAYEEVRTKHLIRHRVDKILEVVNASV